MSQRTKSEDLFEHACTWFKIPCRRVPEASTQTPDYQIELSDHLVIAEVKQLDENEEDKRAWEECRKRGSAGSFPGSDSRVRRKIHAANPQLKRLTAGQHPGVLVLYSNTSLGNYDPEDLHNAMFGSETYTIAYPRDRSSEPVFMGASLAQDGLLAKDRNTSTSAIISLRHAAAGEFSIAFYHNKFAQVPIAPDWLRCNSVRHFASQDRPGKAIPFWVEV